MPEIQKKVPEPKFKTWLKRFGVGAFFFFLIKGLTWLAIFFGLFKFLT